MALSLDDVLTDLSIPGAHEAFAPFWEASMESMPERPGFLRPDVFEHSREWVGLPDELDPILRAIAQVAEERPALQQLAWHCHELLFTHTEYTSAQVGMWPDLEHVLGEQGGAFYVLIALGVVPITTAFHRERGIPEQISRDSCGYFPGITAIYRELHGGRWGIVLRVLYWLRLYTQGELFRTGRMEYMVRPFRGQLRAFRHKETGHVVALATEGVRFAADGFIDGGETPDPEGWVSTYSEDGAGYIGYLISPAGVGENRRVRLGKTDWSLALQPGDPVLDTHIPSGGNMTPEACEDTMRQALEFFPKYFPERPFVGFACGSWILNPELAQIYRPDSNMILWQNELYLYPIPTGNRIGLYFLFGQDDVDFATAPRDTSMRRAVLDHLQSGGRLIAEGMFFLTEDMDKYGTRPYLSHWPPEGVEDV